MDLSLNSCWCKNYGSFAMTMFRYVGIICLTKTFTVLAQASLTSASASLFSSSSRSAPRASVLTADSLASCSNFLIFPCFVASRRTHHIAAKAVFLWALPRIPRATLLMPVLV